MKKVYQNPFIALFFSFFIIIFGLKSFFDLPIALYPDTSQPVIGVHLRFNNISTEDFRKQYGKKIEAAMSSLEGKQFIKGSYRRGRARWEVHFSWDSDGKKAKLDVQSALASIAQSFPKSWSDINVYPDNNQNADIAVSLASDIYSREELHTLLKDRVLNDLNAIEGLEAAHFWLPMSDYIRVELKPSLLEAKGISPQTIKEVLSKKEYDKNLGKLRTQKNRYEVLIPLKSESLADLKKTIIFTKKGQSFRLEDFAEISIETKHHNNLMKANGKKALIAIATIKPSGNISSVCKEFFEELTKGKNEISPEINMSVLLDPSKFIEDAIANILLAIFLGILIATTIIFLFLNSFSHTFVVALSIPLSVIGGFSLMALLGIEINLISLGGLALSVGMVVDGAIVVLENIARHFELKKPKTHSERIKIVVESVSEVKGAVIASLLTTIIVFAPLSFTAPLANAILGDLARVMVCVLIISVFITLYIVPPLLVLLKTSVSEERKKGFYFFSYKFSLFVDFLQKIYVTSLKFLIRSPFSSKIFFGSILLIFLFSIFVLTNHVKREILAEPDSDKVWFVASWNEGDLKLEEGEKVITEKVESTLEKEFSSYIDNYFTQIHPSSASLLITLKNKSMISEFKEKMEKRFINTAKMRYRLNVWSPTALKIPHEALLDITVSGSDPKKKRETLKNIRDIFSESDNMVYTDLSPRPKKITYYELKFDEEKIRRLEEKSKIPLSEMISSSVRLSLDDIFLQTMFLGTKKYDLNMAYPKGLIKSKEDFKNLLFKIKGSYYPLRNFAYIEEKRHYLETDTKNGREIFQAKAWLKESFKGDRKELKIKLLEKLRNQQDFDFKTLSFEETGKEINESLYSLLNALLIAFVLIIFVLILQFGFFKQTFIIMLSIPLGLIGVAFSLYGFSSTLSVNSMLGLILLSGTAVNNSILFTDFFNNIYRALSQRELEESLLQTAALRLRPILITTLTTILGMAPIAFAFGSGGEVLQPLGIAVCGGLGFSTFFTLFVIPLVLYKVEGRKWA